MFGHARHPAQIDDSSEGQSEVLEANGNLARKITRVDEHSSAGEIDLLNAPAQHSHVWTKSTDRVDDVTWRNRGADHLGEHRLKNHEVLVGNESNAAARLAPQLSRQSARRVNSGETAAGNQDIEAERISHSVHERRLIAHSAVPAA